LEASGKPGGSAFRRLTRTSVLQRRSGHLLRSVWQFPLPRKGNAVGKGTVSKKQRANGLTWIYRYQTTRALDGKKVENTKAVALVKDIGLSEAAAWREVGRLGLDNNIDRANGSRLTFRRLAEHFRRHELKKKSGIGVKAEETVATNELLLDKWILSHCRLRPGSKR
jgi:hypothetical protein